MSNVKRFLSKFNQCISCVCVAAGALIFSTSANAAFPTVASKGYVDSGLDEKINKDVVYAGSGGMISNVTVSATGDMTITRAAAPDLDVSVTANNAAGVVKNISESNGVFTQTKSTVATADIADNAITTGKIAANTILLNDLSTEVTDEFGEDVSVTANSAAGVLKTISESNGVITQNKGLVGLSDLDTTVKNSFGEDVSVTVNNAAGVLKSISETDGVITQVKSTVATADIADNAITTGKIAANTILLNDLSTEVTDEFGEDVSVTANSAAGVLKSISETDGVITQVKSTVATADIADSAVTSIKIADDTIVEGDLAPALETKVNNAAQTVTTTGAGSLVTGVTKSGTVITATKANVTVPIGSATSSTYATIWVQ